MQVLLFATYFIKVVDLPDAALLQNSLRLWELFEGLEKDVFVYTHALYVPDSDLG